MRLCRFSDGDADPKLGLVDGDRVIDLSAGGLPADPAAALAATGGVAGISEAASGSEDRAPLDEVRLLSPARPRKYLAIALNYADHIAESGIETPAAQTWFSKATTAVNGPNDPIQIPKVSPFLDYEAEMVAIVGKGGRHIDAKAAPAALFGFCVGNDATVRDWQHRTSQWVVGKSFDSHAPFGPWITTSDEVGDPHGLDIRCLVNGESRQASNTAQLVFDVWAQVEHLSQAMTLEPGDVIFTGTPGGVGFATKPPTFLKAGDVVRVEIDRVGAIEAQMVPEA